MIASLKVYCANGYTVVGAAALETGGHLRDGFGVVAALI
jgi:hypothetical protein